MEQFSRTEMLIGKDKTEKLYNAKIAIFGIGGVGGYCAEALARAGIGNFLLVDNDTVSESNINRQIIALHSTVGKLKVDVMKERILDINPNAKVLTEPNFFSESNANNFELSSYQYIIDAIDTVSSKLILIEKANILGIPIISAMGAGNKADANFKIADIYKTKMCPLARVMRRELKARNIKSLKVVYSEDEVLTPQIIKETESGKQIPATISYVPSVMGLKLAEAVIKDLINN